MKIDLTEEESMLEAVRVISDIVETRGGVLAGLVNNAEQARVEAESKGRIEQERKNWEKGSPVEK